MKKCTKCNAEKNLESFGRLKRGKNGYRAECKECVKEYRLKNYEHVIEYRKQYNIKNRDYKKLYRLKNIEKIKEQDRLYRLNNKDKHKEWVIKNKDKVRIYANQYKKERKKIDSLFKLSTNIRTLISNCIKRQGYTKKSSAYKILGCSFEYFKIHIESQFKEGMNWNNIGEWHIDHIHPVSLATDEDHLIKLNHYTNLQPLWAIDNIKKSNKILT